jgi:CDP-diacylglycerol---glycerol-3-phosphate 3-phosphatidyltransferase
MRAIPTFLSMLRVLALVPLWFLFPDFPRLSLAIFCVAAATDFLDGFFTRRCNATSSAETWIDPLADKILYLGMLLVLQKTAPTILLFMIAWPFEALLAAIRFIKPYCENRAANQYGKIKTTFQFSAIALIMLGATAQLTALTATGFALGLIAVPLAAMSFYAHMCQYQKTA